jgi:hypothetical protein
MRNFILDFVFHHTTSEIKKNNNILGKEGDNFLYSFASLAKRDVSNTRRKQEKEKAPEFRVFPPQKFPKFSSYDGILLSNILTCSIHI